MPPRSEIRALAPARLPQEQWGDRALTQFGWAIDSTILRAMSLVVDSVMMPKPEEIPAMQAAAAVFRDGELQRDPGRFFRFLEDPGEAAQGQERLQRKLRGGVVIRRQFEGEYLAYETGGGATQRSSAGQDRILLEHWMHKPDRPRATVLALHGFSMGTPWVDALVMMAPQWFRQGLDVALLTLPFHGARTPPDATFSGERFAAPNPHELSDAVRRAVYEIRFLVSWLRQRTDRPVGLLGLSLGGYLSALMAGLVDDLDFVVPMVPPVCMGDLAYRFFQRSRHAPAEMLPALSLEELRATYRLHSPLTYPLRVPKERVLIIAGRGDQIVPPEHPHALWEHWGRPDIHWFSGSHVAPFRRGRIIRQVVDHLKWLDIL